MPNDCATVLRNERHRQHTNVTQLSNDEMFRMAGVGSIFECRDSNCLNGDSI